MIEIGIPIDLSQKHFVALCADLRGSRKTEKFKNNYHKCVKEFQNIAKNVVAKYGRCVCQPHSFEGETLKVLFSNPWPGTAIVSALYTALCLHKEVLAADFNGHGISLAMNWGSNESDAFSDAMYTIYFIGNEYPTPPFDSKMLITESAFRFLPLSYRQFFKDIGNKNITKKATDPAIMKQFFEFDINNANNINLLGTELMKFFRTGLIAVLPEGLWPQISNHSAGNPEFLKYLIDNATSEIKILQTYVPGMEVIKDNLKKAIDRNVSIQVLLLKQKWQVTREIKDLFRDIIKPEANGDFDSPLPYQRGKDFNYKRPLQFSSEINTCANALDSLKEDLCCYYNATPSVCLHIIDNLMFVGHFLRESFAVATPHFVLAKGCDLFDRFNQEFNKLWTSEP